MKALTFKELKTLVELIKVSQTLYLLLFPDLQVRKSKSYFKILGVIWMIEYEKYLKSLVKKAMGG
tara:strand:- start:1292 stop:1486 length:195 start_codon:yes stop_codon:yes gene_type:complete